MSGHLLLGVYVGVLLSSIALHWLYQRSAARDEKRWRAEMERCRDEICRLRLTDAEREALEWCAVHTSGTKVGDSLRGLLARLGGEL